MKMNDPIVEEVRKARQNHAWKFGHDLKKIIKDLKRIEEECGHRVVALPPKKGTEDSDSGPDSARSVYPMEPLDRPEKDYTIP